MQGSPDAQTDEIKVWDPLLRIFHWGLVATFVLGYLTWERHYTLHLGAGHAVLGLVVFRILWGFGGSPHARFSDFIRGPARVAAYLRAVVAGRAPRFLGHNPAGGIMILLLLATLLAITLSGVALDAAENRAGPLGDTQLFLYRGLIRKTHETATNLALVLVVLHLLGIAYTGLVHRENLVRAMVSGRKRRE